MSISVSKIVNLPQAALKFLVEEETENEFKKDFKTLGGVFSDTDYAWLSKGPRLQVIHTKTGTKVGAWSFGWVLKDSNTEIVCVDEIQCPHGRFPLLAIGLDCDFSGGMVCIFNFVTSKVVRAIQVKDRISTLHVIDSGYDVFTLPSPLRNFDGIIAVGTAGGDVFLIDISRQICDEALTTSGLNEIRDELNPCQLNNITSSDIPRIEIHKEFAVRNSQHLAIHINAVFDQSTKHFTLKGPKGDDRIHVNKDEVRVSALYYCPQLGSLLIGYNFGALQLYNLMNLELVYTSPVCDEHIPVSHFAVQEPSDDPRAFCYVWAVYSASEQFPTCLPLAVMYAFCYSTKEYHEGYGFLYQDFSTAAVHYQMELGLPEGDKRVAKPRGGCCLKLNSISHNSLNRDAPNESNEDNLTLCVLAWNVWFANKETSTFVAIFDLNQWYKEQMPSIPSTQFSSTYMIQMSMTNLINLATNKSALALDVHINKNSLQQFRGAQKLEEHFCPNSVSFEMCCLRESDVVHLQNYGVQKALLAQIELSGPMCLVEPAEMYQEIVGLGLIPLFIDIPGNTPVTTNQQREIILGTALENQLMGWLCKCASEWANGSFLSTGCSLDFLITWAFQRAITLKNNCDSLCIPLFDYSELRLDNNTNILLNSCTRQLKNLRSLYTFIITKLYMFISNQGLVEEQFKSLQMGSVYFEVLQWLLNVGLLPECPLTAYPRSDDLDRINAPYPAEMLTDFYNHRRGILRILNEENFASSASVLFIDTLIENECGRKILQEQWRNDGGNGLYPPPSLQALLRTYLIDNVDLSYKHSVTIYVFLDLAMTLDQDKYKPVITHLIKFPAVFKVSPSVIKITQAFWQLDHGDYNTAMGLLLDPLISNQDLSEWHHQVALRSLLLQKQQNFALLYVQVRKPTFLSDDDVKTAISLYVANNMLDEAFYFEKHFATNPDADKFLFHLFNECRKNDKLSSIIFRTLSDGEEKSFLKYLLETKNPVTEDLHVYYNILRSHYIEAFESHERTVPNQIENQGLMGQETAILRDKVVHNLKKLLPDIKRDLLNLCHKEKNNIWIPASRPTPMSVFVYNHTENVQYKSSLIGAALAKAKQLFNETINDKCRIETEATPFLRTPRSVRSSEKSSHVVVDSKIIDNDEDDGVSPAKRLKLSPRGGAAAFSTLRHFSHFLRCRCGGVAFTFLKSTFRKRVPTSLTKSGLQKSERHSSTTTTEEVAKVPYSTPVPVKLDTPVIKRKTPKAYSTPEEKFKASTPHSILKVRSLANHTASKDDKQFKDDFKTFEKLEYTPVTTKTSGLHLSPRRSLSKTSSVVRFEGLQSSSSSLNTSRDLSAKIDSTNQNSSVEKNSSAEDEIFYSPDSSLEDAKGTVEEKSVDVDEVEEKAEEQSPRLVFPIKARRSYKRSLGSLSPVRSSPRLSKLALQKVESEESTSPAKEESDNLNLSPANLSKLRPRKSLCRQVLETNALSRVLNSPVDSPKIRVSKKTESTVSTTEESFKKFESSVKYDDGEEIYKATSVTKHNHTMSFVETDLDVSEDYSIDYDMAEEPKLRTREEATIAEEKNNTEENDEDREIQKTIIDGKSASINEEITRLRGSVTNNCFKEPPILESSTVTNENIDTIQNDEVADLNIEDEKEETEASKSKESNEEDKDEPTNSPDPEMNVFEISDDLSVNEGLEIQKEVEVSLEENDLCYDQQITLESVLEENINATSSPLNNFEKNVFIEELSDSEEASDEESEHEELDDGESENFGTKEEAAVVEKTVPKMEENEVIEIGSSSSEDEDKNKDSSEYESERSSHDEDERLEVSYEKNIYDSDDNSLSKSSYERHYSEISENSDDFKDESRECSLFHGGIILTDELKQSTKQSASPESSEDDEASRESEDDDEKVAENIYDDLDEPMEEMGHEAKLFDEDQFITRVGEEIEESIQEVDDTKKDFDQTSPETGLFHGEIFVDDQSKSNDSHKESQKIIDYNDEKIELGTITVKEKCRSNEQEEMSIVLDDTAENIELETVKDTVEEKCRNYEKEERSINNVNREEKPVVLDDTELEKVEETVEKKSSSNEQEKKSINNVIIEEKSTVLDVTELETTKKEACSSNKQEKQSVNNVILEAKSIGVIDDNNEKIETIEEKSSNSEQEEKRINNVVLQEKSFVAQHEIPVEKEQPVALPVEQIFEEKSETFKDSEKVVPEKISRDPLDLTILPPSTSSPKPDILDNYKVDHISEDAPSNVVAKRTRSAPVSEKKGKDSKVSEQVVPLQRSTRKNSNKSEPKEKVELPKRVLRPRGASADEPTTSNSVLRERSTSVDQVAIAPTESSKEDDVSKSRKQRAASVGPLPKIDKEGGVKDVVTRKMSRSVLEGYSGSNKSEPKEKVELPKRVLRPRRASADEPTKSNSVLRERSTSVDQVAIASTESSKEDDVGKNRKQRAASVGPLPKIDEEGGVKDVVTRKKSRSVLEGYSGSNKSEPEEKVELPKRVLRPRRASADEPTTSNSVLRERSASVDQVAIAPTESSKEDDAGKSRKQRAASVAPLPKIDEEDGVKDVVTRKKSRSVLEGFSGRVTRQQKVLLTKFEMDGRDKKLGLAYVDPIVLLDKMPFEGKPDPDEKKVYEKSPSSTNSPITTPQTPTRRLRSGSQASETSQRSKSKTPVRSVRRLRSTEEEEAVAPVTTRSRARSASVSTVNSDDSNASETAKIGKRRKRVVSQTVLQEIKEESKSETEVPKKRLRKNSARK